MSSGSPRPKWSQRMNSAMRRTSTLLTVSRPSTPSVHSVDRESSDSGSIRKQHVDTTPAVISAPEQHVPSPIAESPAREAAALQEITQPGPSPLAQAPPISNPEPMAGPDNVVSPVGFTPPPLLDSTVGNPGAFTDEPEELPQPQVVQDPYAPRPERESQKSREQTSAPIVDEPKEEEGSQARDGNLEATIPSVSEPISRPRTPEPENVARPRTPEPAPRARTPEPPSAARPRTPEPAVIPRSATPEQDTAPRTPERKVRTPEPESSWVPHTPDSEPEHLPSTESPAGPAVSYFGKPMAESMRSVDTFEQPHPAFVKAVDENTRLVEEAEASQEHHSPVLEYVPMPVPAAPPVQQGQREPFYSGMPEPTHHQPTDSSRAPPPQSEPVAAPIYTVPPYVNYEGHDIWGGAVHKPISTATAEEPRQEPVTMPLAENGHASQRSRGSSIRTSLEDPFADPVPTISVSDSGAVHIMPHPGSSEQRQQQPAESHEEAHGAIVMPLPPIHEVIPGIRHRPSNESLAGSRAPLDTDERRPLLPRPNTSRKNTNASYLQPSLSNNHVNVSAGSPLPSSSTWLAPSGPRLHELGWLEYQLPDGTCYYVHPTRRVVADLDLRQDRSLNIVSAFLEDHTTHIPQGAELWLRNAGNAKKGIIISRSWVDHHSRAVVVEKDVKKGKKAEDEDALDMQYRYWSFMEAHPAHTALPAKAKGEAMDILTWAWTDRLLPPHHAVPAPFTQEECNELSNMLRSYNTDNQTDLGIQTRIVSRILLRVARWRQLHFRPNKPLPKDVTVHSSRATSYRRPFRRVALDIFISCICLGIPYIFTERGQHHRFDEESGIRTPGPMLVIGACTCIIAAIVLSASVTFLSLPGLDSVARVAGLVAILFASFSMASTLVAIFRYKTDMARAVSHLGGEGLMIIPRRPVVMSLPLVFLAYAIIGFITGIVTYSFRGVALSDATLLQDKFDDYTRWTAVGVIGALAGMFTMSLLLSRR